jgi:hypothetical protein
VIGGAVAGGVAALALASIACSWFYRRYRQRHMTDNNAEKGTRASTTDDSFKWNKPELAAMTYIPPQELPGSRDPQELHSLGMNYPAELEEHPERPVMSPSSSSPTTEFSPDTETAALPSPDTEIARSPTLSSHVLPSAESTLSHSTDFMDFNLVSPLESQRHDL